MALIALVACCDTKYHELCFAKQKILESGNQVLVIDIATGPDIRFKADITRETVLEIGGHTWEQVHNMAKSDAISAMTESMNDITIGEIFAGSMPYLTAMIIVDLICIFIPAVVTFLPSVM